MASQAIYVDLDLKTNELLNVGDASAGTSAPNLAQVESLITTGGWTPAAAATAAGLGLTSTGSTIDVAVGATATSGLEADETGLWVNTGAGLSKTADGVAVNVGTGLTIGADDLVAVVPAYVQGLIDTSIAAIDYPVDSVTGTAPILVDNTTPGSPVISIDATALDFPVDSVGVTAPITNTGTASAPVIGVDVAALSTALDTAGLATDAEVAAIAGTKANAATAVTAGAGLTGGGTLAAAVNIDVAATDASIAVAADGISVAPAGITTDKIANGAVGNLQLGANLYGLIDVERLTTEPGAGVIAGNILTYNGTQWAGAAPAAVTVPVKAVTGTAGEIVVTETPAGSGTWVVDIDDAITTAITANATAITNETAARGTADTTLQTNIDTVTTNLATEVTARTDGDTALGTRIDSLAITGTGMVTVTESAADSGIWTVDVPAIQLANTYSGTTGVDSGTITAEIAPAVAQAGDLYVNSATGQAFIYDGDSWTELAAATAHIISVASGDGSLTVTNGAGPNADLVLSAALQAAIATATSTNGTQDAAIGALQTTVAALDLIDHAAAVSGSSGIAVDATTQAVSLVVDPVSGLTQGVSGLTIDLTTYATDADVTAERDARTAADTALQAEIDAEELARAAGDTALDLRVDTLETSQATQNLDIDALEAVNATQDGAIDTLEARHTSATFSLTGTGPTTVTGPIGGAFTVRDAGGCVITISVCEVGGTYTLDANVPISGTIFFG
jgi:hypothetical protein